jgi:hypothetical protein
MGAIAVDCVQAINSSKECDGYDYILVEDRDKKRDLPNWLKGLDRVCNIPWLKQCLVSSSFGWCCLVLMVDHGRPVAA